MAVMTSGLNLGLGARAGADPPADGTSQPAAENRMACVGD